MNEFQENVADTSERTVAERHIDAVRQQGGVFVEAVRRTRMPMIVTDATLPGNPIVFANQSFADLSGYSMDELLGQDPHFMNGEGTDPEAIRRYEAATRGGRDETLEILQYRKDGTPFRAMLFASPVDDGQGTVTNHFLSYLDITRRYDAEESLRALTAELEVRVGAGSCQQKALGTGRRAGDAAGGGQPPGQEQPRHCSFPPRHSGAAAARPSRQGPLRGGSGPSERHGAGA
jgi:PAS domain S-box-containing protein